VAPAVATTTWLVFGKTDTRMVVDEPNVFGGPDTFDGLLGGAVQAYAAAADHPARITGTNRRSTIPVFDELVRRA
jgi:hypothetical protein